MATALDVSMLFWLVQTHTQDVAHSQIRSVCFSVCLCVLSILLCAQTLSHCEKQSMPWPLCVVAQ